MLRELQMSSDDALVARSVQGFVASVAAIDEAVPAGGSVAALTGAASAALLALVCGVHARKGGDAAPELLARARALQARLLELVDEDADAFRGYLQARRERQDLAGALQRTSQTPLAIAAACVEVVNVSRDVEGQTRGLLLGDVHTARRLAGAALAAALDIAAQNLALHAEPAAQARLQAEITRLRRAQEVQQSSGGSS